jgi:hypothetical protein
MEIPSSLLDRMILPVMNGGGKEGNKRRRGGSRGRLLSRRVEKVERGEEEGEGVTLTYSAIDYG